MTQASYILKFTSMAERAAFLAWQQETLPHLEPKLSPAANMSDVVVKEATNEDISSMRGSPYNFEIFDDTRFGPANRIE